MSKIRQSAKGETCTLRIPGVCNRDPETTVLCHAPHPKKGMGIKGPDTWAAYGCSACHAVMDGRSKFPGYYDPEHSTVEVLAKTGYWHAAIRETQDRLIANGHIKT